MEAASRNFPLSATEEGPPRNNIARNLMKALCRTLKFNHKIKILPKSLQSLTAINYYLFGVDGKGVNREMRTARIHLTEKFKKSEIFNLLLEEGLKSKDLQKLFTDLKSQWNAGNEVINENSIIVLKKLNGNEVTIEVDPLEKNDIRSLKGKLQSRRKKLTSKIPYQKGDGAGVYVVREFMAQFINTLKNDHHIRVPKKRFENINAINYYLFGVGIDREMEEFHICLTEKLDKSRIFSIFLEEGLKNKILQANFEVIKSKLDKKRGALNEKSVIVIEKLSKNQVTVSIDILNNKIVGSLEEERKLPQLLSEEIKDSEYDLVGDHSGIELQRSNFELLRQQTINFSTKIYKQYKKTIKVTGGTGALKLLLPNLYTWLVGDVAQIQYLERIGIKTEISTEVLIQYIERNSFNGYTNVEDLVRFLHLDELQKRKNTFIKFIVDFSAKPKSISTLEQRLVVTKKDSITDAQMKNAVIFLCIVYLDNFSIDYISNSKTLNDGSRCNILKIRLQLIEFMKSLEMYNRLIIERVY